MAKVHTIILLICLARLLFAENSTEVPTFDCVPEAFVSFCTIQDPVTSKNNPNFKISHPTPHKVGQVVVSGGNLAVFTSEICDYFPNLSILYLQQTGVQELDANALDNCANLLGWFVKSAKIEEIPLNFFQNMPLLDYVYFNDTPIKRIDPAQFHGSQKLAELYISLSHIEEFPLESITSDSISFIFIESSNLKDFPAEEYMKRFPRAEYVGYSDNDIKCSRVQEMNDFFNERGVEVFTIFSRKPREEEVVEVEGVLCVP